MSNLGVINPIQITDALLISSTAAETDYAIYNSATTYALNQYCISTTTHRIYQSVAAGNLGNDPTNVNNQVGTPAWWLDVSPTNKWKIFDGQSSSQTVVASPLTVVLHPGFFNAIYLGNIIADNIAVTVKDAPGGNVIYSYSAAAENSQPLDYYEHFFSQFRPQMDFIAEGIEPHSTAELTVTLTSSGNVACGLFAIGDLQPLGQTLYGVEVTPKTYSYINIDAFGNNQIVRRKAAKDLMVNARIDLVDADYVTDVLTQMQDIPAVWIASDDSSHRSARAFGLCKGKITFDNPLTCSLNLNIQGLI